MLVPVVAVSNRGPSGWINIKCIFAEKSQLGHHGVKLDYIIFAWLFTA